MSEENELNRLKSTLEKVQAELKLEKSRTIDLRDQLREKKKELHVLKQRLSDGDDFDMDDALASPMKSSISSLSDSITMDKSDRDMKVKQLEDRTLQLEQQIQTLKAQHESLQNTKTAVEKNLEEEQARVQIVTAQLKMKEQALEKSKSEATAKPMHVAMAAPQEVSYWGPFMQGMVTAAAVAGGVYFALKSMPASSRPMFK